MSRLTDEFEQRRLQREADMREAQSRLQREAQNPATEGATTNLIIYGLYTYQAQPAPVGSVAPVACHIYAPGTEDQCQQTGRALQQAAEAANHPAFTYMVLPVEPLPE